MANKEPVKRVFRETQEFYHDLFKLEVSKMLKWVGHRQDSKEWFKNPRSGEKNKDWLELEHTHVFHTINSNGQIQYYCAPVGGHFHRMKVVRKDNGVPEVVCDSGPLKFETKKVAGKFEKVEVPATEFDNHKHKVDYVRSDQVKRTQLSKEAAKVIGHDAHKLSKAVVDDEGKRLAPLALR